MEGHLQVSFDVLGKSWTLRVLSEKYFKKKNGNLAAAVTKVHRRRVELRPKFLDHETITHELVHAYLYEMCLHSMNDITVDDLEEVFAELMAKRGRELLDRADQLHDEIHESMKSNAASG